MIARPWRGERPRSRVDRAVALLLRVLSVAYGIGAWLHRQAYVRGFRDRRMLACRVVSIGSLWVGGTAKTPIAAWVAARLQAQGHRVALASRGHGRTDTSEPVTIVSDGRYVRADSPRTGDEAWVLAAHAPGVPVLVGPDRAVVGWHAEVVFGTEVLVLDDGFQHHGLARDVDLVTVDAAAGLASARVLPAGPLREPARALGRADAVLVVDGPLRDVDEEWLSRQRAPARRFSVSRCIRGWRPLAGGRLRPPEELAERRVGLLCGIARPASFRRSAESLGVVVADERILPDHHAYVAKDLQNLDPELVWLTTEKDAGKILPRWCGRADVRVLVMGIEVEREAELLDWLQARLRGHRRPRAD